MQTYVIDILHIYTKDRTYWPKEIALLSVDTPLRGHWIIKSPHTIRELPPTILHYNRRKTRHFHGLEWTDGSSKLSIVEEFLHSIAHTAHKIFIEGRRNVDYLESFMSCQIIESTRFAPLISSLPEIDDQCALHAIARQGKYECALNRAQKLRDWLKANENIYEPILENEF